MKNLSITLVLVSFTAMFSCNQKRAKLTVIPAKETTMKTITYLALGDSYTIGESVPENSRWPVQLANKLSTKELTVNSPRIIAKTGWTTDELQVAIKEAAITEKYGLVSLLIGVNNQYRGSNRDYTLDKYKEEYTELLETAISFANGDKNRVFVVSIPDYSVTPFAQNSDTEKINRELKIYNNTKKEITESMSISFVDITPISLEAKNDSSLVAGDGLHPSAEMYRRWVDEVIYEQVKKMIE